MNLLRLAALLVGCFTLVAVTAAAVADDKGVDKDKIVGKWKLVKEEGKPPRENIVIEFTKDGKLKVTDMGRPGLAKGGKKVAAQAHTMEGTFKVEKDKLNIVLKQGGKEEKGSMTIKTLTDKKLVTLEKGRESEFEKMQKK